MYNLSLDDQLTLLMNGSEFGDEGIKHFMANELRQRLIEAKEDGRSLRVYCGYDVTGPDLHLGHTVTMRKLRQFQELGHEVTMVIGSFTSLIGDASDRDTAKNIRPVTKIRKDAETYAEQAYKILDPVRTQIRYNHEWLGKLTLAEIFQLASQFTLQQFLMRDNFAKRYDRGDPIWLREFLYPLAQGYDAVTLKSDVQIGATEQLFNLMVGRKLQIYFGQQPQVCITFPILVGTDGIHRMSKSTGNYIGITESPEIKFLKVMNLPDGVLENYMDLLTRWNLSKIHEYEKLLKNGKANANRIKNDLAWEIVASIDGEIAADNARERFCEMR